MKKLPKIKDALALYLKLESSGSKAFEHTHYKMILDYDGRPPYLWVLFGIDEDSENFYNDKLMIWGAKLMAEIIKEDWDLDDVAWRIEVGFNFHGFPDNMDISQLSGLDIKNEKNPWSWCWVGIFCIDAAS